jgi:hypothetical protein
VKLLGRQPGADEAARLKAEFGVDEVYFADSPIWYLRATARFTLTWQRELATAATIFVLGLAIGFFVARL